VPLERQDIERRDFPVSRRGYEPKAVDAHLRRLADEMERVVRSRRPADTVASASAEQVRAIVAAAEATSAEITRQANEDADRARGVASAQAREHLARVSEASRAMLERLEAIGRELDDVVESLRSGAGRLTVDLDALQSSAAELRAADRPAEPRAGRPAPVVEDFADEVEVEEAPEAAPAPEPEPPAPEPEPPALVADDAADAEGARLIALNMALSGTPRAQADRYLAENFDLDDRERLLDDVYSRVG
jgi:DivIVA domain-containing protein